MESVSLTFNTEFGSFSAGDSAVATLVPGASASFEQAMSSPKTALEQLSANPELMLAANEYATGNASQLGRSIAAQVEPPKLG